MPKIARISAKFLRANRYFMGNLSPQQQKIWFLPFIAIAKKYDMDDVDMEEIVVVSLDEAREFLGSKQSNKELKRTITTAFQKFSECYNYSEMENLWMKEPFRLKEIKNGYAYFRITDIFVFSQFGVSRTKKQYFVFDLDEISSYKNNCYQKSRAIPLLWYCMAHRHWNKNLNCWEIEFGDRVLKMVLGLDVYDYLYVPQQRRECYIELDKYFYEPKNWSYVEYLMDKYNVKDYEALRELYLEIKETVFFKRWDFEQKVLLPAIEELNKGQMLNFILQDVLERPKNKGEKATTKKSYIGKNYTALEEGKCIQLPNGDFIDKNVTLFTKLKSNKQYKFLVK